MALLVGPAVGLGLSVTVRFGLTTLFKKVLEGVKLLAQGSDKFLGLQNLLSRLQEPTAYLVSHEDKAGKAVVHEWLASLREELARAKNLVIKWQKIKRWDKRGRQKLVKRLISVSENLQRLDNSQIVTLASYVRNFDRPGGGLDRLGGGVDRLGDGVDRLGEEVVQVKTSVESLTSKVRSLTEERKELVQATKGALADDHNAILSEAIEEITRKALGTSGSMSNLGTGSGPSRSSEAVTHFNIQSSFPDEGFGGNDILDKVIEEILDGDYLKCVGLWNMGGRVYHDPRIQNYFDGTRHQIWVTVSQRSTYSVMEEIFKKIGGNNFPAADDEDGYAVKRALKGLLDRDKFLLVIDDVWDIIAQLEFIDWISEPKDSKRRVILVTTRDDSILRRKHATKIEVSLLSGDDSWKLFSRNAFGRGQVSNLLRDVSRSVGAESKGPPLALKVIGSTLAGETNLQMWHNSLKKLQHASVLSKEHEEQIFGKLQLSVDNQICDRDRDRDRDRDGDCDCDDSDIILRHTGNMLK